eukprot:snap_masked-scaffold_2-processed-gene-19.2-mRNA-1 protein AED:1.00 eAED:1.00 QI:0/-1/0/0/-1/1/1/0/191
MKPNQPRGNAPPHRSLPAPHLARITHSLMTSKGLNSSLMPKNIQTIPTSKSEEDAVSVSCEINEDEEDVVKLNNIDSDEDTYGVLNTTITLKEYLSRHPEVQSLISLTRIDDIIQETCQNYNLECDQKEEISTFLSENCTSIAKDILFCFQTYNLVDGNVQDAFRKAVCLLNNPYLSKAFQNVVQSSLQEG